MKKKKYIYALFLSLMVINSVWGQIPSEGTYTVPDGGYTMPGKINIAVGKTLIIDLNGQTLHAYNSHTQAFEIPSTSTLTIKDSSTNGKGRIVGNATGGGDRGGFVYVEGTLNLEGGIIEGFKTYEEFGEKRTEHIPTQGGGGAIYINDGGTFNMSGGTIKDCSTYTNSGDIICAGGAVFVDADEAVGKTTTFNFTGGIIDNCSAGMGGAVYVHAPVVHSGQSIFNMSGTAKITNCKALYYKEYDYEHGGGGVMVASSAIGKGQFYLSGNAEIKGCQTLNFGCGVMVHGIMDMSGGTITGCYPSKKSDDNVTGDWSTTEYPNTRTGGVFGGGVFTFNGAVFTMTGGVISNNKAASGGGVMVWGIDDITSQFIMEAGEISGNQALGQGGLGNGGAVYVQASTFNFRQGKLSGNKAVRYGGAININQSATLTLDGYCTISGNRAAHGGGLSQEQGKCEMSLTHKDILIDGNHAEGNTDGVGYGGGIFIEKGIFTVAAGTISNNIATGCGGGASLRVKRIVGDMEVNIIGGTISGNKAGETGGGIDLYADKFRVESGDNKDIDNGDNKLNDVVVNFNKGTLSDNEAKDGAGIYVHINKANSTANMNIGTASDIPEISGNRAGNHGGGVGMNEGAITILNGILTDNHADKGNGGAVYLGSGTFTVTGNVSLSGNSAKNGGAICIENGTVEVAKGTIQNNTATECGAGMYVFNGEANPRNIIFAGDAVFSKNTATKFGGGVYAEGLLVLNLDATFEDNEAENGGGIYLKNGVEMTFGHGLIRRNRAVNRSNTAFTTAYGKEGEDVNGVGGGIFLAAKTKLNFLSPSATSPVGIYENRADCAADDVFANGNNTTVNMPAVAGMELKDFNVPTDKLYWVEDYAASDTENYRLHGTNKLHTDQSVQRYQYALRNFEDMGILADGSLASYKEKYLCLSLGYELVFVHLIKKGLDKGDVVAFLISYRDQTDTNKFNTYRKVYMVGLDGGVPVERIVALPTGEWRIVESEWGSWKYEEKPDFEPVLDTDNCIVITTSQNKTITITNKKKPVKTDIREKESIKENWMKPLR